MSVFDQLTPRQRDCLRGVANYKTYKEIARDLGISDSMVEKHLRTAREKMGVESTSEAARLFIAHQPEDVPQVAKINLAEGFQPAEETGVSGPPLGSDQGFEVGENLRAADYDRPLSPLQTLSLIGRMVLGSIIGLLLLIACAEGLKSVLT